MRLFFFYEHMHYRLLVATNDVIFLDKDYRTKTTVGLRLIKASEAELELERRRRGEAQMRVLWHVKPKNDWTPILARLGYAPEEIIMGKLTGGGHGT